jgi:hypothetical protein
MPRRYARASAGVGNSAGISRADKYTRSASRTNSERVLCSALIARSISLAIAGGSETVNVVDSRMVVTLSYLILDVKYPHYRPSRSSHTLRSNLFTVGLSGR